MIQLEAKQDDIRDETKLFALVEQAMNYHFNMLPKKRKVDYDYYNGNGSNEKYIINKAKYINDMSNSLFVSVPPTFTTSNKEDNEAMKEINKKLRKRNFGKHIFNVGKGATICGDGFLLIYNEDEDKFPRFVALDPLLTDVVFDCSVNPHSLFGFTFVEQVEKLGNGTKQSYYKVFVYTDEYMYVLRTASNTDYNITYFGNISVEKDKDEYRVRHFFDRVPITMFKNNEEETGDAEPVYGLIDAFNHIMNNRLLNLDQVVEYILFLKNVRLGDDKEIEMFDKLMKKRIIAAVDVDGKGVDAKFLANPLNQADVQILQNDTEKQIHTISRVPDFSSDSFAQNASSIALQLKLTAFIDLAGEKERCFDVSMLRIMKMIQSFIKNTNSDVKNIEEVEDINIVYTHNLPSNDSETITQLMNLNSMGLLNKKKGLEQVSWIKDVDIYIDEVKKEMEKIKKEQKVVVDKEENINNNNYEGSPQSINQMDNRQNFNKGLAKDQNKKDNQKSITSDPNSNKDNPKSFKK